MSVSLGRQRTRRDSAPHPPDAPPARRHRVRSLERTRVRRAGGLGSRGGASGYIRWMRTSTAVAAIVVGVVALAAPGRGLAQSPDAIDAPRISMQDFKKLLAAKNV